MNTCTRLRETQFLIGLVKTKCVSAVLALAKAFAEPILHMFEHRRLRAYRNCMGLGQLFS